MIEVIIYYKPGGINTIYWRTTLKRSHLTRDVVELIAIILVLFFVARFVIHGFHMQSSNMQPEVNTNSYVLVNSISYTFNQPHRGDAIVFHYPLNTSQDAMARIIGMPGDTIKTDSQHVWVDNIELKEPYVKTPFNPEGRQWVVPANSYFVLNDNRQMNDDSRSWGPITKDYIIGKAIIVYWPTSNWHMIGSYPSVFQGIKNAQR